MLLSRESVDVATTLSWPQAASMQNLKFVAMSANKAAIEAPTCALHRGVPLISDSVTALIPAVTAAHATGTCLAGGITYHVRLLPRSAL